MLAAHNRTQPSLLLGQKQKTIPKLMKNVSDPLKLFSNPFGNFKKHENHSRDFVEHVEGI